METNEYLSRIAALRQHMSAAGVDAFIIPSADPHKYSEIILLLSILYKKKAL